MSTTTTCVICTRPSDDAFLCVACWSAFASDLRDVAGFLTNGHGDRMAPLHAELETAMARQDRHGKVKLGSIGGTPERPLPVNLPAGAGLSVLRSSLAGWVRLLCEERGVEYGGGGGTAADLAQWLLRHEHTVRGFQAVDEMIQSVSSAIARAQKLIDAPSVRVFVGECGHVDRNLETGEASQCDAPLYADTQYAVVQCRGCDTTWPAQERWQQHLADLRELRRREIREMVLGPRPMAAALSALGIPVDESTVRKYARDGRVQVAGYDIKGYKLYRVSDVINIVSTWDVLAA